ncbi:hypothetical protein K461DRAFT_279285 [Myriangium duriaei CBS 260.36]|uniref:SART-1 protein n=1 Tax=Myriangium duriaei CBS 260.36 TaxID=1168546 RepID=A0A9P4IXL4_9PEZI|nr:hypothetical protein K461DRAFT_279285 [Myriangium duriaei CBS 260.36]
MDAIAIADANKIRAAMGLPPLPVPGDNPSLSFKQSNGDSAGSVEDEDTTSTLERRSAAAGSNWAKLEAERQDRVERQKRKEAAKKARDAAARFTKLEGKGLGEADGDEEDTRSWLMGQKKRQKKIEKSRKAEEDEIAQEKAAQRDYGAKDLKGLKVAHEADDFGDGEQILTLKDAEIGEDGESGEDELENADLAEKEKLDERLERKKKRPIYDPNEVNESGEKTILGQYDEELGSKKKKRFTLDDRGGSERKAVADEMSTGTGKGIKISLDALMDDTPVNDYADPSTAKVRKPKKAKKERKTRRKEADEDDIPPVIQQHQNGHEDMEIDGVNQNTTNGTTKRPQIEVDDDEDLQTQLAMQRRATLKKRKKMDAAELARQIREASDPPAQEEHDGSDGEPGLVIDETREFVSHLQRSESDSEEEGKLRQRQSSTPGVKRESAEPDSDTEKAIADGVAEVKRESASASPEPDAKPNTSTGLDEEETTSSLGSVAAMLRKRGLISAAASSEASARADHDRRYADFLAANRVLIAEFDARARSERESDRASGALNNMSASARQEYARRENEKREAYLAQLQARHFASSYRPDVKLSYTDEHGRSLGQKEAFKHLSHMFHGKGSGKGKLEKRLKKIDDEKRREARALLDQADGQGMGGVMREQERRRGQAGVRLQ